MMRPRNSYVIVKLDAPEVETKSGLFLPMEDRYVVDRGEVLAVGPKCREVEVGDRVGFSQFSGTELDTDEGKLLLIDEQHLNIVI